MQFLIQNVGHTSRDAVFDLNWGHLPKVLERGIRKVEGRDFHIELLLGRADATMPSDDFDTIPCCPQAADSLGESSAGNGNDSAGEQQSSASNGTITSQAGVTEFDPDWTQPAASREQGTWTNTTEGADPTLE